jgi:hypothetical protein
LAHALAGTHVERAQTKCRLRATALPVLQEWQDTQVFDGAIVSGAVKKAPISAKHKLTLRLLGVDAPELHCSATASVKKAKQSDEQRSLFKQFGGEYRQPLAESAVLVLAAALGNIAACLPCVARTWS